jgi:hypothetical protein
MKEEEKEKESDGAEPLVDQISDADALEESGRWYNRITQAFENKEDQNRDIEEAWNIYNCFLDENQQYKGNTQAYVPVVRDAIDARTRRKVAQLFPSNDIHTNVVSTTGDRPTAMLALLEHYIRETHLRSVVESDMKAGDCTGQWNLLCEWSSHKHSIIRLVEKDVEDDEGNLDPTEPEPDIEEEEIEIEGPRIATVATEDVAVIPPTVDRLDDADIVVFKLRLSRDRLEQMQDDGYLNDDATEDLIKKWDEKVVPPKDRVSDAGIKSSGTYKYALIYAAYGKLKIGKQKRHCIAYFAGDSTPLGLIENPDWSRKCPLISAPANKLAGSFFGMSNVTKVKWLQWMANDVYMMSSDSAQYSMMPIIMTDPLSNPNYQTMVMGLAAVWAADPNKTKALEFPQLWKDGFAMVDAIKKQIWESMDVTEAMMGRAPSGRKNSQQVAQMSQEQNIPITDEARRYEQEILEPLLERMAELDGQYRTKGLTTLTMGELGQIARVEEIPPQQYTQRYFFRWTGTDYMMSLQKAQQSIQLMNVLRGVPPQQLNGRRLDVTPILDALTYLLLGPDVAPRVLIDERKLVTIDPEIENDMLAENLPVSVHGSDDDIAHLKSHNAAAKQHGDAHGGFRKHMAMHLGQLKAKAMKALKEQQGTPGLPGAGAPGVPGTPRPGAVPAAPRGGQAPPGAIPQDQMADPMAGVRG